MIQSNLHQVLNIKGKGRHLQFNSHKKKKKKKKKKKRKKKKAGKQSRQPFPQTVGLLPKLNWIYERILNLQKKNLCK